MLKRIPGIILISFFLFMNITVINIPGIFAAELEDTILRIQKSYENIKDLKGSFVQKNIIKSLNKTDVYKGDFFIKYPLKMKWSYKGKAAQDIVVSNDSVIIYKKGDNQAYKGTFDRTTYGQAPIALLSGFGDIKEEFMISGKGNSLILKPKKAMGNITSVKINISEDEFPISSFIIQDGQSNIVEIGIKDVSVNTGLKDSVFEMVLPKGVNVYEQHP